MEDKELRTAINILRSILSDTLADAYEEISLKLYHNHELGGEYVTAQDTFYTAQRRLEEFNRMDKEIFTPYFNANEMEEN